MGNYLDVLNSQQREAVVHEGSPLLILAGAGSGKTRVITTKIAYLIAEKNIEPFRILSVTFTKKAANEMRERAIALEPLAESSQIRTFHSFGTWFLRKFSDRIGLESSFTVYDDNDMVTLLKKAVPGLSVKEANTAARQIALAKDYCLTPEDDLTFIGSEFDLNEIYGLYEKRLRATGNTDFGDLIMLPVRILESDEDAASYIRNRFSVIMVDEYQDSNIAQYKLLQKLSGVEHNSGTYVCVVGDDDQSIYHFRGAEVQNILSFPQKFPGTEIIRLERNYRSTSKILNAASLVVNHNSNRLGKNLIADRGEGGQPVLAFLDDANQECVFCGDLIKKSIAGGKKYSDWAILYRTNAQSLGFEKEFLRRKIPYIVVGSLKFYEREEIKDALAYVSLFSNHKDEISFRRIINKPARGIGEKTQDKILESAFVYNEDGSVTVADLIDAVEKFIPQLSKKAAAGAEEFVKFFNNLQNAFNPSKKLSDLMEKVVSESHLDEYHKAGDAIEGTQRIQNLQELVNSAMAYPCTQEGLTEFLDSINLDRTLDIENDEKGDDAVTLITLHNTKGLEYNNVIITGLEEGIFPRPGKTGAELEEERRLFYVGITRARNELYVTSTGKRPMYGSWQFMKPSPFLKESSKAFKIIGHQPAEFCSFYAQPVYDEEESQFSEYFAKWKKGTKLYHDDYGYGVIINSKISNEEFVIEVQFESREKKKFLPAYQAKSLTIIKE